MFVSKNILCNHRGQALETPKPLISQGFKYFFRKRTVGLEPTTFSMGS
ncbi:MAG: hypothetical protein JGK21_29250 [Microcoleus sp. PH2017_22_RUC_O_B]|nr:hypothetical protein [Microcoleus sp. PH2017_22_RUC_O_B]MCC3532074.1 hypothetical protein [Microcoleus sp. PH2017_21_RUC_O_A]MCC3544345.1 hypothetical protein [Microcoleus sp. PH2017_22_RUC_O_B]